MPALFFQPDATWEQVMVIGSFEVDADVPPRFVADSIYPERRRQWIEQMARQGYLHRGGVYLFSKPYAVTETTDNDRPTLGRYEHDATRRGRVNRKMAAYFWRRKPLVEGAAAEALHG